MEPFTVYTIGHSTHTSTAFVDLLCSHGIEALGDVRSTPYSRFNPQFNREPLERLLRDRGIAYVYLGEELGARPTDPSCYENGRVQLERLARTAIFQRGLERVRNGAKRYRLTLMCAEKEPLECHRTLLVARALAALGARVNHILEDGALEPHEQTVARLLEKSKLDRTDLFRTREESIREAYGFQARRIGFAGEAPEGAPAPLQPDASAANPEKQQRDL